jgi:hypothetical protein
VLNGNALGEEILVSDQSGSFDIERLKEKKLIILLPAGSGHSCLHFTYIAFC